jgi:hypothetical protein
MLEATHHNKELISIFASDVHCSDLCEKFLGGDDLAQNNRLA